MQSLNCDKHQLRRNYVFCLESKCDDGLVCERCFVLDQKHNGHKLIMVKCLIENDEYEIKRIFGEQYADKMKNGKTAEQFIQ